MSVLSEFNGILARLDRAIEDSLKTEVANAVKDEMHDKVHELVYDAYPVKSRRSRRMDVGGLSSVSNYDARVERMEEEYVLIVENNTPTQNPARDNLVEIVEEGFENYHMPFARPFVKETEKSVDAEAKLIAGLRRNGF